MRTHGVRCASAAGGARRRPQAVPTEERRVGRRVLVAHLYFLSNSFLMWLAICASCMNSLIAKEATSIASFSISSDMSTVFTTALTVAAAILERA